MELLTQTALSEICSKLRWGVLFLRSRWMPNNSRKQLNWASKILPRLGIFLQHIATTGRKHMHVLRNVVGRWVTWQSFKTSLAPCLHQLQLCTCKRVQCQVSMPKHAATPCQEAKSVTGHPRPNAAQMMTDQELGHPPFMAAASIWQHAAHTDVTLN